MPTHAQLFLPWLLLQCHLKDILNRISSLTYKVEAAQDFYTVVYTDLPQLTKKALYKAVEILFISLRLNYWPVCLSLSTRKLSCKPSSFFCAGSGIFYECLCSRNTVVCLFSVTGWLIILSSPYEHEQTLSSSYDNQQKLRFSSSVSAGVCNVHAHKHIRYASCVCSFLQWSGSPPAPRFPNTLTLVWLR